MSVKLSLADRVALITGGSRGIGAATVRLFTQAGARVVFNYQKAKEQADKLVQECGEANCAAVQCDLTGTKSAADLVYAAVKRFGRLDILVANHGVWPAEDQAIDQMPDEQWLNTISVNLNAVFALIKHSVAQMKKQERKGPMHIVLVSSTSGQRGEAYHCDYSATKGAINAFTKTLAQSLIDKGIRVNAVAPGPVWTPLNPSDAGLEPKDVAKFGKQSPLGRPAQPEELAPAYVFLASNADSSYITGTVLQVMGGETTGG